MRIFLMLVLAAAHAVAFAQADVGLVNLVSGDVSFAPQSGAGSKPTLFMKVRDGDRFTVGAGGQVRVVYFDGARQERWQGPASFQVTKTQGSAISGKPAEVANLPAAATQRIARIPELVQNAKLGGIQVRAAQAQRRPGDGAIEEARATYDRMRKELPADDITAEMYLYSTLNEFQRYEEMLPLVDEMARKQPQSEDVRLLKAWLNGRLGR
jgi:hypothetical protein